MCTETVRCCLNNICMVSHRPDDLLGTQLSANVNKLVARYVLKGAFLTIEVYLNLRGQIEQGNDQSLQK